MGSLLRCALWCSWEKMAPKPGRSPRQTVPGPTEGARGRRKGVQMPPLRASPRDRRREWTGTPTESNLSPVPVLGELSRKIRACGAGLKSQVRPVVAV